jgi:hypothetical protein
MALSHYGALLVGYTTALLGWVAVWRVWPSPSSPWPPRAAPTFARPWREVLWALVASAAVIGVGQLYVHGLRLRAPCALAPVAEAVNQIVIFSPLLVLLALRHQSLATAWLPTDRVWARVGVGLLLALLAVAAFTAVRPVGGAWATVVSRVYRPHNLPTLVQVLLEDVAIAILFVRLRAALGRRASVVLVAVLFAAGHVPTLLATHAAPRELAALVLDAALGVGAITVLQRSADVWWFWQVHFAMDMMQFVVRP